MNQKKDKVHIRDFIYLDVDRLKSILSQIERGLIESKTEISSNSKKISGRGSLSIPTILKAAGGTSFLWENRTTETKTLHDHIYNFIENELLNKNQLININVSLSVEESFAYEREYLRALPVNFPLFPLKEKRTTVRRDGTVYFDGNYYQVRGEYRDRSVLCINTGEEIMIYHNGQRIGHFPYLPGTESMVMLSEHAIEAKDVYLSDTVRQWALEVAKRQVQIYQEIIQRRSV